MIRCVRLAEAEVCYRRDDHGEQVPGAPGQGGEQRQVQGAEGRRGADQGQLRHSGPIQTTLGGQEVIVVDKKINQASDNLMNSCHNFQVQSHPGDVHTYDPGEVETLPRLCQPQVSFSFRLRCSEVLCSQIDHVLCTYSISSKFQS